MARIIDSTVQSRAISNYYPVTQIVIVGMILGLLFWGLNSLLGRYVNSASLSDNISTILVATVGLVILVTTRMPRPIVIILSSAATLWGLSLLTGGLWFGEAIAWDVVLYALTYALFSWISRYPKAVPVLVTVVTIIVIARITTTL